MKPRLYKFIRAIARAILFAIFPIKRHGARNVPDSGAVLLCSNHISNVDPVALGCSMRRIVHYMAKTELFKRRWSRWFLKAVGAFPVVRGGADIGAIRASLSYLKNDEMMGIYPQGHRYRRDEEKFVASGTALIALKSGAAVIPVFMARYRPFRFLHIYFGEGIELGDLAGKYDAEALSEAAARIAKGIWESAAPAPR